MVLKQGGVVPEVGSVLKDFKGSEEPKQSQNEKITI
jgi:hypothetical protein